MGIDMVAVYGLALASLAAPPAGVEADVARGVAQVKAGDYATAVATLEDAIRRLSSEPAGKPLLVQAYLHLAVAHHATGDSEGALAELGAALDLEPGLKPAGGEVPAEVVAQLDRLREQRSRSAAPVRTARRRRALRKAGLMTVGGAALAGGGVALYRATRNDAIADVTGIRYAAPVVVCADGQTSDQPLPFALFVDVRARESVAITGVRVKSIPSGGIVSASVRAITGVSPASLVADAETAVRIDVVLACNNGVGNPAMFGLMRFAGQIETSAGAFRFEALSGNVMRYEMP